MRLASVWHCATCSGCMRPASSPATSTARWLLPSVLAEQHALTMALVLAITAKTEANSQRAVLVAGELAGRMQPLQVAQCQTEAKRIVKSAYN